MKIRITVPVLDCGSVQFMRGQELDLPEELAVGFVERKEAALVPFAEQATRPRPETAVLPRVIQKPKPKGR